MSLRPQDDGRQAERGRTHQRGPQGLEAAGAEGGLLPLLGVLHHNNHHQVSIKRMHCTALGVLQMGRLSKAFSLFQWFVHLHPPTVQQGQASVEMRARRSAESGLPKLLAPNDSRTAE